MVVPKKALINKVFAPRSLFPNLEAILSSQISRKGFLIASSAMVNRIRKITYTSTLVRKIEVYVNKNRGHVIGARRMALK